MLQIIIYSAIIGIIGGGCIAARRGPYVSCTGGSVHGCVPYLR